MTTESGDKLGKPMEVATAELAEVIQITDYLPQSAAEDFTFTTDPAAAELPSAHENVQRSGRLARIGRYALKGGAVTAVLMAPAVAHGMNKVEDAPTTKVPIHIAGTEVTATRQTGSNVINITALGHKFTTYSHLKVGNKDIGYDINLDTSSISQDDPSWTLNPTTIKQLTAQFSNPTAQKHEVTRAVEHDMKVHFAEGFGETLAIELGLGGIALYGRRRLKKFSESDDMRAAVVEYLQGFKPVAYGAAGVLAAAPLIHLGYTYASPNHPETVQADPALVGTPLEGWGVSGPLKPAIDAVLPNASKFIRDKNAFYDNAQTSFTDSFKTKYKTARLQKQDGVIRVIYEDDPQGIDGTQAIVGEAAKAYNADVVLLGGDLNTSGSKIETDVADTLYDHVGDTPVGASLGHHDNEATIEMEKERHFTISDDKVQKIGPLAVYGINDAERIDGFGLPAYQINPGVTNEDITKKAIDYLCSDAVAKMNPKPIVLVHDKAIGTPIAQTGCVPTVLTGRQYEATPPIRYGDRTTEFISGSTGGHGFNEGLQIWGIIKNPATFHEIELDAKTNEVISYDTITISNEPGVGTSISPTIRYDDIRQSADGSKLFQADGLKNAKIHNTSH
jgi:hypothetical protein